jgi:hypothetical protein
VEQLQWHEKCHNQNDKMQLGSIRVSSSCLSFPFILLQARSSLLAMVPEIHAGWPSVNTQAVCMVLLSSTHKLPACFFCQRTQHSSGQTPIEFSTHLHPCSPPLPQTPPGKTWHASLGQQGAPQPCEDRGYSLDQQLSELVRQTPCSPSSQGALPSR